MSLCMHAITIGICISDLHALQASDLELSRLVATTAKRQSPQACFATQPKVQLCACQHAVELSI